MTRHQRVPTRLVVMALLLCISSVQATQSTTVGEVAATANVRTVISNADSGTGTLRQVLLDASSGDIVLFSPTVFRPSSPAAIALHTALPEITQDNLVIDASNAGVILDGSMVGGELVPGLLIRADGVIVRGLQVTGFTGCGIDVRGQANTIGGNRQTGAAPTGQGNLLSGNRHGGVCLFDGATQNSAVGNLMGVDATGMQSWGIQGDGVHINGAHHNIIEGNVIGSQQSCGVKICCSPNSAYNIVSNNLIGVAIDGQTPLTILDKGVSITEGANHNTVGPGNIISRGSNGVAIEGTLSPGNTILGNSIYNNYESGISLWNGSMDLVRVPAIASFDLTAGTVAGLACPDCLVQIYSDEDNEGSIYEGQAMADHAGAFSFKKGVPLAGPHVTATATDASGTTSMFSVPTVGLRSFPLQSGNASPFLPIAVLSANQLSDNRMSTAVQDQSWVDCGIVDATVLNRLGAKGVHGAMNDPDHYSINWETDENVIHANFDQMITELDQNGIAMTYILIFWDKEHYRQTGQIVLPRFQTEDEIQRYLDFVRRMVRAFGDRVDYYELWNEPGNTPDCLDPLSAQCIPVSTFISMGKRAIAAIREEDPGAKIVVPSYHAWDPPSLYEQWLYPVLSSSLMPLVDVIAWHPFIVHLDPEECGGEFFDRYWDTVFPTIKQLAITHGFQGEFRADDLKFPIRSPFSSDPCAVFDRTAGKYYVRELVHHLGEDVAAGTHGVRDTSAQVIQRLATLMAGAQAQALTVEVETSAAVHIYTFALPDGDRLIALWHDALIADGDQVVSANVRLPGLTNETTVAALQVLDGYQQRLVTVEEVGALSIEGLLVREYPLLVRLSSIRRSYLPVVAGQ